MKTKKCFACGMIAGSEDCCKIGKKRYLFNWIGGGWNDTHANTIRDARNKVLKRSVGKQWKPDLNSFRPFTMKEYNELISATNMD
jgi:hypothetical protein